MNMADNFANYGKSVLALRDNYIFMLALEFLFNQCESELCAPFGYASSHGLSLAQSIFFFLR